MSMHYREVQQGDLTLRGPARFDGGYVLFEAFNGSSVAPDARIYSSVVVSKTALGGNRVGLGGTRIVQCPDHTHALRTAGALARAMDAKTTLIYGAACRLGPDVRHYSWAGGKGTIWVPAEHKLGPGGTGVGEARLRAHAALLNFIAGDYLGSLDQGLSHADLELMNSLTDYTIGLKCGRDTGEATAEGVKAGLLETIEELQGQTSLDEVRVLVLGLGKVGLPLAYLLDRAGADVVVFDPQLDPSLDSADRLYRATKARGGEVDEERHLALLRRLVERGSVFDSEVAALEDPTVEVVSPNGGGTDFLGTRPVGDLRTRGEILAAARRAGARVRLILGAGNDQLGSIEHRGDALLQEFTAVGIVFIPDPIVSGGGVVAVSHELLPTWDAERVNDDSRAIARECVRGLCREARLMGGVDAATIHAAYQCLTLNDSQLAA